MAVIACASGAAVMKPRAADEGCGGMTAAAIQGRRNVVNMHTYCRRTVVTRSAIIDDAGVIKTRGDEAASIVTNAAILTGSQMIVRFCCSKTGIVT